LKTSQKSTIIKGMTTKEVADLTGIGISTICKYAEILKIDYYGEGRRKVYDWKKTDIDRLKKSIGKRGRPPKKDK
jgi:DNA-binding transcriptional MerR regulator